MNKVLNEDDLHNRLFKFMTDADYESSTLKGYCNDITPKKNELEVKGYEVFPQIMTTGNNECSIFIRKKKI